MQEKDLSFVIPTYRLREVGETIEPCDDHFSRNGHSVPMVVFDDSSPANQENYYPLARTHSYSQVSCTASARKRKNSSSLISMSACPTSDYAVWRRACSFRAMEEIAITRLCTRAAA